ncbi:hypothetical protein G6F63_014036 [Rhizopus arrhizus]|nr:hypothetical protein G6F63_014036 [Rhizopus arrhizus]
MGMADQGGRNHRADLGLLQQLAHIHVEQARIAAQLATHEHRRAELLPLLLFQRLDHLDRHAQARADILEGQSGRFAGLAPAGAAAGRRHERAERLVINHNASTLELGARFLRKFLRNPTFGEGPGLHVAALAEAELGHRLECDRVVRQCRQRRAKVAFGTFKLAGIQCAAAGIGLRLGRRGIARRLQRAVEPD